MNMAQKQQQQEQDERFRLRPLFGMAPQRYVCIVAIILIGAAVLWGVLAVANYRYRYTLLSSPSFASISIEEHGTGVAPWSVRLAPGSYRVQIEEDDYVSFTEELVVERALIDLFRRAQRLVLFQPRELAVDARTLATNQYQQLHGWSLTGIDQRRYQKPPVISNAIERVLASGEHAVAGELLQLAARDVGDEVLLADWLRAAGLLHANRSALSAVGIVAGIREASAILHANPRTAILAELILENTDQQSGMALEALQQSQWRSALSAYYVERAEEAIDGGLVVGDEASNRDRNLRGVEIIGSEMITIPAGQTVIGGVGIEGGAGGRAPRNGHPLTELRIVGIEGDLYIAAYEVSVGEFRRFLADNPRWQAQNRRALIADGLVDDGYLRTFDGGGTADPRLPASEISWHAANAYCRWLQGRLPEAFADYEVRLPTEREWLYAVTLTDAEVKPALFSDSPNDDLIATYYRQGRTDEQTPYNMLGSVWEWNDTLFHVSDGYFEQQESTVSLQHTGGVRSMKGGSAAVTRELIQTTTEAALYADATSYHIGFRPVIALRRPQMQAQ